MAGRPNSPARTTKHVMGIRFPSMTSWLVPVLCLVATAAITIGAATALVEMTTEPPPSLPLDRGLGDRDSLTGSAVADDYGGWGPAPDTGGGRAAPIPHPRKAAISDTAESRPHDRPGFAVRSSDG
ncbi:uncharacterized protein J3R85_007700 [Psidium guajava]|nr:uncharacterized protein J3R85_007700 [Psidium guajava]